MVKKFRLFSIILTISALALYACSKEENDTPTVEPPPVTTDPFAELDLPEESFNYANIALPEHYTVSGFPAQF